MQLGVYSLVTPDYRTEDAAELVAEIGYSGIEWTVDYPEAHWDGVSKWHIDTDDLPASARTAREAAERRGLTTVALGARCDCFDADAALHAMEAARLAGAKAIRVHAPLYDGSTHHDELFQKGREAYAGLEEASRRSGVKVWVEIHNGRICASASATRRLLEGFDPEWIGAIFDPGNMVREGMENWRMAVEMLGPYLQHVHVKDMGWLRGEDGAWFYKSMSLADGMVDWEEIIGALRSVGYQGFLNVEDLRGGHMRVARALPTRRKLQEAFDYLSKLL